MNENVHLACDLLEFKGSTEEVRAKLLGVAQSRCAFPIGVLKERLEAGETLSQRALLEALYVEGGVVKGD